MKEKFYQSIANLFDSQKYDPDWNIRQNQLAANKSRGRKGADFVRYRNEVGTNGQPAFNLDALNLEDRLRTFEAFLQPDQPFQVFIPGLCLKGFFKEVMQGDIPRQVYKGVSYNPNLLKSGEKLDNLDFFAWSRRVQEKIPDFEITILDASPYQVINQIKDPNLPNDLAETEVADWFYAQIERGVENDPQIQENCRLRNLYLRALLGATGVQGKVVSALDLIRNRDPELLSSFEEARRICGMRSSGEGLINIDRFVSYRRYGDEFAKTYTPAVIAEAIYFLRQNGIKAKLGPTSEMAFDQIIADAMGGRSSYNFFWYSRPFEKNGTRENRIYVEDKPDDIQRKLRSDSGYAQWLDSVLNPFSDEKDVTDKALDLNGRIRRIVQTL